MLLEFCDLVTSCVVELNVAHLGILIGYQMVALNTVIEDVPVTSKKKKGGSEQYLIPDPIKLDLDDIFDCGQVNEKKCKILNRITFVMSDPAQGHKLNIANVRKYDIVAVQPTAEIMFQTICTSRDIDIISLELTERTIFRFKKSQIKMACGHEVAFEILYVPLIKDRTLRRNILANGQKLVEKSRGKNILLSSGASQQIDFRGPYDVANLGLLFGMSQELAKNAVSRNGRSLLLHAEARRSGRAVIKMTPIAELELKDHWKIERLKEDNQGLSVISETELLGGLLESHSSALSQPPTKKRRKN
uniref:Uncharacterized protein n=1 Tax=Strigamia maritima TaxID=126957 RepID=T1ISN2_STRMM